MNPAEFVIPGFAKFAFDNQACYGRLAAAVNLSTKEPMEGRGKKLASKWVKGCPPLKVC